MVMEPQAARGEPGIDFPGRKEPTWQDHDLGHGASRNYGTIKCFLLVYLFWFFFFLVFLGLHLQHMEVPRLGVKSEL